MKHIRIHLLLALLAPMLAAAASPPRAALPTGFVSLFNGRDLSGWKIPVGDNGHWKVLDGVIDYDARSEAPAGKQDLWTEKDYGDFVLRIDWRIKETAGLTPMPDVLPSGDYRLGPDGKPIMTERPNADSGIYLRGLKKAQLNIWCWPIGSGEVHGYMVDKSQPPEVRAGVVPKVRADNPVGEWNTFEITLRGDRLTLLLNGKLVLENAQLPGVPPRGPIGLQHHGGFANGKYKAASSLMQFRNIMIKELPSS
jgi:hypothetical protein